MEPRARYRTLLRRAGISAALAALIVPAVAGSADAKNKVKPPVITRVSPLSVHIGQTLTIHGHNFRRGRMKNTVVFKRDGGRAVFIKAPIGTKKLLRVKLPDTLVTALAIRNGGPVATRFRLRVLTTKLSKRYTSKGRSPVIGAPVASGDKPTAGAPDGDCDGDGVKNGVDTDDDNDLLPDTTEVKYHLEPCDADTDGDGVTDGYEYQSAVDLNNDDYQEPNAAAPYPGKRPYPNPLDKSDADTDFDGDSLTLKEEFRLWQHFGNPKLGLSHLNYSDGLQYSIYKTVSGGDRHAPNLPAAGYSKQIDFINWATNAHYLRVLTPGMAGLFDIRDADRNNVVDGPRAGIIQAED